jgi:hypothetical protein
VTHVVVPVLVWYWPPEHATQLAAPDDTAKAPALHAEQTAAPLAA